MGSLRIESMNNIVTIFKGFCPQCREFLLLIMIFLLIHRKELRSKVKKMEWSKEGKFASEKCNKNKIINAASVK